MQKKKKKLKYTINASMIYFIEKNNMYDPKLMPVHSNL